MDKESIEEKKDISTEKPIEHIEVETQIEKAEQTEHLVEPLDSGMVTGNIDANIEKPAKTVTEILTIDNTEKLVDA